MVIDYCVEVRAATPAERNAAVGILTEHAGEQAAPRRNSNRFPCWRFAKAQSWPA